MCADDVRSNQQTDTNADAAHANNLKSFEISKKLSVCGRREKEEVHMTRLLELRGLLDFFFFFF